jgi:hypothetical protein
MEVPISEAKDIDIKLDQDKQQQRSEQPDVAGSTTTYSGYSGERTALLSEKTGGAKRLPGPDRRVSGARPLG